MFRIAIVAAVLSTLVVQADPPEAKAPPKPLSPRDYLPTLLLKTQLDATRDYAASLESLFKLAQSLSDAGFVPAAQTRQVERELLQTRIDLLKKDREHLDALDQYQAKSDVSPERVRELEETTFGALRLQVRKFERVGQNLETMGKEVNKYDDPDSVQKLRGAMSRIISSAEAFRDTSFRKDFALRWDYWHRQSDRDIAQLLQDKSEERRKILADKIDLEQDGRQLSPAGQKLLNAAEFEIELGRFELTLRRYERMPWKDQDDAAQRQADMFRHVAAAFGSVVLRGLAQRMDELRSNWPQVEPLSFQKVDLLGGDRQQAERAVAGAIKNPEAAAAAKANLRKLRSLAETYRIGTRLVEMAIIQRQQNVDALRSPSVLIENAANSETNGPVAQVLASEKDLANEKSRLYRTWIEAQLTRIELASELGVPAR